MRLGNPIVAVASSLYSALLTDLPEVEYESRSFRGSLEKDESVKKKRRPYEEEVSVYCFPQMWGSTALGFGGMGGASMTNAYTVVVVHNKNACVYFDGRLAYAIDSFPKEFWDDVKAQRVPSVEKAKTKYNKKEE